MFHQLRRLHFLLLCFGTVGTSADATGMALPEFLQAVQERNVIFKSFASSKEASTARREQGDLSLSPLFRAGIRRLDDRKPTIMGPFVMDKTAGTEYSMGLARKFASGTNVDFSASASDIGPFVPATPQSAAAAPYAFTGLSLGLSQSLWKDFFGLETRYRREREALVERGEYEAADLQARSTLREAELAFWDAIYIREELEQREASIARAKKIETWVKRRYSNGIGDRADVLNAEGLVARRELELLDTINTLKSSEIKIRSLLQTAPEEKAPELTGKLDEQRPLPALVGGGGTGHGSVGGEAATGKIVSLEAYLSVLEAKAKAVGAREAEDSMEPDLTFEARYGTNGVDPQWSPAWAKIADTSIPTTSVGLRLSLLLDGPMKESVRRMARMEALASSQKKERKLIDSEAQWKDLLRTHEELSRRVEAAGRLAKVQVAKAEAERDKLSKGRSITLQVIQAEQDAAESELVVARMQVEHRKLEANARLYVEREEGL
ncbi:MAG: TolC family protein [Bdellovibrio sp.]|nr:MAG: TolC family protein [Bdellovibrio sp.]